MLEALDHEVGRLLGSLSESELGNTIIIFIGDNGTPREVVQSPYSPGKAKGTLYEGGIRVPLIVSGVGVTRKGEYESALVNSSDLFATIADIAQTSIVQRDDSYSFKQLFGSSTTVREVAYCEISSATTTGWAIRDEHYKLIHFDNGSEEFIILPLPLMSKTIYLPPPLIQMLNRQEYIWNSRLRI